MRARAGMHGLLVGLAALGAAGAASFLLSLVGTTASAWPPIAVGSAFIDATPGWLKDFATSTFGTGDKAALGIGMALVLAAVFFAVGVLARTSPTLAQGAIGVLGAIGVIATLTRPGAAGLDPVPGVVGTGVGLWLIAAVPLVPRAAGPADPDSEHPAASDATPMRRPRDGSTRRGVLAGGLGLVGVLLGLRGGAGAQATTASRAAVVLPPAGQLPTPAAPPAGVSSGQLSSWVVGNADFYRIDTALSPPRLTTSDWRLVVTGAVEQPVTIDWAQLVAKPMVSAYLSLSCVSNEVGGDLVGNALWQGWPVRELLAMARPTSGADMVLSRSADGWTAGTPLTALTDDRNALLAIGMNGQPLPVEHGFPARLVVPGLYGYVSATKWVTELKVTTFAQDQGYWTPRGWAALGPVKTASRIEVPRAGTDLSAGRIVVAGTAWAMHRGISAVQVQIDGGQWADAQLAEQPTIDAWRQWVFGWDATAGRHTVTVRAMDGTGQWQTATVAPPAPDGATGYHSIQVTVG